MVVVVVVVVVGSLLFLFAYCCFLLSSSLFCFCLLLSCLKVCLFFLGLWLLYAFVSWLVDYCLSIVIA